MTSHLTTVADFWREWPCAVRNLRKSCDIKNILKEKALQAVILASTLRRLESVIKKSSFLTTLGLLGLFLESTSPILLLLNKYCEVTLGECVNLK